jgi:hypothetical protein
MSMLITKFTITLFFCFTMSLSLLAQNPQTQTADSKVSNHEAVCDGALELIPSTANFQRKRYVKTPVRPVKIKKRK